MPITRFSRRKIVLITAQVVVICCAIGLYIHFHKSKADFLEPPEPDGEYAVNPYISSTYDSQLYNTNPGSVNTESFYLEPWRAYLETVPATTFLNGVGVNQKTGPSSIDKAAQTLAYAGVKSARYEVEWGSNFDMNDQFIASPKANFLATMTADKKYGIRPTVMLWAHEQNPVPNTSSTVTVVNAAAVGATSLTLTSVSGLKAGYSGYTDPVNKVQNNTLFTAIDSDTNTVTLSRPLTAAITAGRSISVHTFKYLPLYPVGTPQFNETSAGWIAYVKGVTDALAQVGVTDYDIEVWNELSFGSAFTNANNYYGGGKTAFSTTGVPDFLHSGGNAWQLANLTVQYMQANHPGAQVLWGFSSTTFLHTGDSQLPPGITGETYHPYGASTMTINPASANHDGHPEWYSYVPTMTQTLPEGFMSATGQAVERLTQKIKPSVRLNPANWPAGNTQPLRQIMTEEGTNITETALNNATAAVKQAYKAKNLIRSLIFLLNKGYSQIDVYAALCVGASSACENGDNGYNIMNSNIQTQNYGNYSLDQLLSPALIALRNMTQYFNGATTIAASDARSLTIDKLTSIGHQYPVFAGDATHPTLYYRDRFTFLPFQVDAHTFIAGIYVMSEDATNPPPGMDFRFTIGGIDGTNTAVSLYDPLAGADVPTDDYQVEARTATSITIRVNNLPDSPWLLKLAEGTQATPAMVTNIAAVAPINPIKACFAMPLASTSATSASNVSVSLTYIGSAHPAGYGEGQINNVASDPSSQKLEITDQAFLAFLNDTTAYKAVVKPSGYIGQTLSSVTGLLSSCVTPPKPFVAGDLNGDNKITLPDLVIAIGAYNGGKTSGALLANQVYGHTVSLGDLVKLIHALNVTPTG